MDAWSFSKISTFEECPRKFKYIYVDKLASFVKSDAMTIGEGIHAFIEFYSLNPTSSLKECEDVFTEAVTKSATLVNLDKALKSVNIVKWYRDSNKVLVPYMCHKTGTIYTEKWFKLECGNDVKCNGKIDIITMNHSVVDYKTSTDLYDINDVEEIFIGKGLQLTIYAAAYYDIFKELPKKVGFQVLLKDMSKIQNLGSVRSFNDIKRVKEYIVNVDSRYKMMLEKNVFTKGMKPKCFWCNFRAKCQGEL